MPSTRAELPYISVIALAPDAAYRDSFTPAWNALAAQYGLPSEVLVVPAHRRNHAIRQAQGEFILTTHADAEFSPHLFEFLAARQLDPTRFYRLDSHQGSTLHTREGSFPLTPAGLRETHCDDITPPNSGIYFGENFFPPEHAGKPARWLATPAKIHLHSAPPNAALELDLEPGPGLGPLPQPLHILDDAGALVATFSISGRTTLRLWPPPSARLLRLTTPDSGHPLLDDLRILDFRCFRCAWVPPIAETEPTRTVDSMRPTLLRLATAGLPYKIPQATPLLRYTAADIFGPGIAYCGQGWHRPEHSGPEIFRWVDTHAELVIQIPHSPQDLCLLLEPGPSLQSQPFHLTVSLAEGPEIARARVAGITLLRIALPLAPGTVAKLLLSPDRHGGPLPRDTRVLNFRVLSCACAPSRRPAPPIPTSLAWTSVTVSDSPAASDWSAILAPHRPQLNEIGKPAFLHTNACDFILMSRDRWLDLRGYPEVNESPHYLDTLLCYSAHFAGAREEILRAPIRMTRPPDSRTPTPLDDDLIWLITQMRRLHAPVILNTDDWGSDA